MQRVNALLFLIMKPLKVHQIDDSAVLHLAFKCGYFFVALMSVHTEKTSSAGS
jgi:hypothetical protein